MLQKSSTSADGKYRLVPIDQATTPKGGLHMIYNDRYWIVKDGCILFYIAGGANSPQCNTNEAIAKRLCDSKSIPDCEVQFIPFVFQEADAHDYVY